MYSIYNGVDQLGIVGTIAPGIFAQEGRCWRFVYETRRGTAWRPWPGGGATGTGRGGSRSGAVRRTLRTLWGLEKQALDCTRRCDVLLKDPDVADRHFFM
jgi:hypothetical protein